SSAMLYSLSRNSWVGQTRLCCNIRPSAARWPVGKTGRTLHAPMPIRNPTDFRTALAPNARLMGLDVGTKTVGLAISDTTLSIASPLQTLRRTKFAADAAALRQLIARHGIGGLIVGLPVNMDGSEGPRAQSVRAFADNLLRAFDIPLAFWDERLSTAAV